MAAEMGMCHYDYWLDSSNVKWLWMWLLWSFWAT